MADAKQLNKAREKELGHFITNAKIPVMLRLPKYICDILKSRGESQSIMVEKAIVKLLNINVPKERRPFLNKGLK